MPRTRSSPYQPGSIDGLSSSANREVQNIYDRLNYLTQEVQRLGGIDPTTGMAKAEKPQAGIITIPGEAQDGFIRVNVDGVISSYVNPVASLIGLSLFGSYLTDVTVYQTGGNTTETNFTVKTLESNLLANDGDFLLLLSRTLYANNGNTKRFRIYFDATPIFDTTAFAFTGIAGGEPQFNIALLQRESSVTLSYIFANLVFTGAGLVSSFLSQGFINPMNFVSSHILKSTGQNGAASPGDITQAGFFILKGDAKR
jgi:hypothetical protein